MPTTLGELVQLYHTVTDELASGYFGRIGDPRYDELRQIRFWCIHALEHDNMVFGYQSRSLFLPHPRPPLDTAENDGGFMGSCPALTRGPRAAPPKPPLEEAAITFLRRVSFQVNPMLCHGPVMAVANQQTRR